MRLQSVKFNMMQLTNKRTSKIQASYKLEGTVFANIESIKYLGVTLTEDLKWNTLDQLASLHSAPLRYLVPLLLDGLA